MQYENNRNEFNNPFKKRTIMKKLFLLLVSVFTLQFASADNDKTIPFTQLPAQAQQFVKQNFADGKIAFVKKESEIFDTSYDLMFVNGDKIEFDKKGAWTEVKCKHTGVPAAVIPTRITEFVNTNYPDAKVLSIEKDRYSYEVKLSNFWEIKFDLQFNVIDMDSDD